MHNKMKIKVGDTVRVMAGADRGKEGKVTQVFPETRSVVVDGVRNRTKHIKPRGEQKGQRITFFAPIAVSNVALVGKNGVGRVGYEMQGDKKVRVLRAKKKTEQIG